MKVFEILNDTKYAKTYLQLVDKAKNRQLDGYGENHHIIPKSLGGTNDKSNKVKFTAREHFIAHLLLSKAVDDKSHKAKMGSALNSMLRDRYGNRYQPSSKMYDIGRKAHAQAMTGREVSAETREKISAVHKGKNVSQEVKIKMANAKLGKPGAIRTPEWIAKLSAANTGKKASPETKAKLSAAKMGKPGKPKSEETKAKMADARRLYWEKRRNEKSAD